MKMVAFTLSELKAAGLLDSCVFVAASEFSDGGAHATHFLPTLVAGQAKPLMGGRHVAYRSTDPLVDRGAPCNGQQVHAFSPSWARTLPGTANRCVSDLWQSALEAVGAFTGTQRFGDTQLWSPSVLTELWR
jgi:hypothetical protein